MARRYINTSQFNPYSFQELWQPAQAATTAHMQQAAAFTELGSKAAMLGDFIDREKDVEEYAAWQNFTQNLRQGADSLMRNGLNTNVYNSLWQSSVDYAQKIKPIEVAVENKQKFAQILSQTSLQHPNTLFIKDANDYSLKDYRMGIPQAEVIDIDAVQKEAETIAAVYANDKVRFMQPQQYDRFRQIIVQKYGDTFDEAMRNIADPNQRLYQIKQMVLAANGADRLLDNGKEGGFARLEKAVDQAIITGAVGKRDAKLDSTAFEASIKLAQLNESRKAAKAAADAAAMMETSKLQNSLVWDYGPGKNSRRQYGWGSVSYGKDALKYQEYYKGILGDKEVMDMKGRKKKLEYTPKEKNASFRITFEGVKDDGEYNLSRSPYYLIEWNGDMYRVTADQLGLPRQISQNIEYIFGNSTPSDPFLAESKSLVDSYRRDPYAFSQDPVESAKLQELYMEIIFAPIKNTMALQSPTKTNYKVEEE